MKEQLKIRYEEVRDPTFDGKIGLLIFSYPPENEQIAASIVLSVGSKEEFRERIKNVCQTIILFIDEQNEKDKRQDNEKP